MTGKTGRSTKGKIVAAAWRLFYEQGFEQTSVEEIIAAVTDVVAKLRGFSPVWRDLCAGKRPFIL